LVRWQTLKNFAERHRGKQGVLLNADPVASIVFAFTYPRLDANVTKVVNHLLKSPFCVHPSTGKISVPIDFAHVDEFSPDDAPTLADLFKDIDECMADDGRPDLDKTRLAGAARIFEAFLAGLSAEKC
jgi:DNA primase small subunit